ncbi:hypothetical protein J6590_027831 [Homalodisca vitripennis]|nr:hypothetical protein J6590_027831 [Homalodisca vitripennis]
MIYGSIYPQDTVLRHPSIRQDISMSSIHHDSSVQADEVRTCRAWVSLDLDISLHAHLHHRRDLRLPEV